MLRKKPESKLQHRVTDTGIMNAIVYGTKATALCGYRWLPTEFEERAEKFPPCVLCETMYNSLKEMSLEVFKDDEYFDDDYYDGHCDCDACKDDDTNEE